MEQKNGSRQSVLIDAGAEKCVEEGGFGGGETRGAVMLLCSLTSAKFTRRTACSRAHHEARRKSQVLIRKACPRLKHQFS